MAQDQTKKEALFNEVKGSLFEYLLGKNLSAMKGEELIFLKSLDPNYAGILSQQDRMVRQFYPEMLSFLSETSKLAAKELITYLGENPHSIRLMGKFSNFSLEDLHEADLIFETSTAKIPLSVKLNKQNAYVNTKSGGIKSFFQNYFPFIDPKIQQGYNTKVDMEFNRMSLELHAFHDMDYTGNFQSWVKRGFSELPGELSAEERVILKLYYARLAQEMHTILSELKAQNPKAFSQSLAALLGFSSKEILQLICFHDFKSDQPPVIKIHSYDFISSHLAQATIKPFQDISSVEIEMGPISLQVRIKPMNKFTTTAIKINCSVKVRES